MDQEQIRRRREYQAEWMRKRRKLKKENLEERPKHSIFEETFSEKVECNEESSFECETTTSKESPETSMVEDKRYERKNLSNISITHGFTKTGNNGTHQQSEVDQPTLQNIGSCDSISGSLQSSSLNQTNPYLADSFLNEIQKCSGVPKEEPAAEKLRQWALKSNCSHSSLEELLQIFRELGHDLPKSARTLLQTPAQPVTKTIKSNMEYVYLGITEHLRKIYTEQQQTENIGIESLKIAMNIDGLPIFKSSSSSFWLVLGKIVNSELSVSPVFVIAICFGQCKPKNLDFLEDTVDELDQLLEHGLLIPSMGFLPVELSYIVCDTPAKALVKSTKLFSGYSACYDCNTKGQYHNRRMTYPDITNLQSRTDHSFRNQSDPKHHVGSTPFLRLNIDMIKCFPIDYMHACLLGVMKKLMVTWFVTNKGADRLSPSQISVVNDRLRSLRSDTPVEFQRKPRQVHEVCRWKATEFRTFLLYTGKVVLKGILSREKYNHFLYFSVAITILLSAKLTESYSSYAQQCLEYFVYEAGRIYGQQFLVYNIHSLLHLSDQAKKFGSLEATSAFPFENYMQTVKKKVRSTGSSPLAQVVQRLKEQNVASNRKPVPQATRQVRLKTPNNIYLTNSKDIVQVLKVKWQKEDQKLQKKFLCRVFTDAPSMFDHICDSRLLGIYAIDKSSTYLRKIPASDLTTKCFIMNISERASVVQTLSHQSGLL